MKLPVKAPSTQFQNAPGSSMPQEFAMAARVDPGDIAEMAETPAEVRALQLEALARQYVFVVDRSGSMQTADGHGTRWTSAAAAIVKLLPAVFAYDVDSSVPLFLFDHEATFIGELTSPDQVMSVFRDFCPRGTTDLAGALEAALSRYAGKTRANFEVVPGTTVIVLLDGAADDREAVTRVLHRFADPQNGFVDNHTQLAVSFVQIGDNAEATAFLQYLDDGLGGLDIVDAKFDNFLSEPQGVERLLHDAIFD
jgi:Mg-chelatase subunit ChlD